LGNGDGTFQPGQNFSAGENPNSGTSADVNGDGLPDLITANHNNTVSVLLNTSTAPSTFDASLIETVAGANTGVAIDTMAPVVTITSEGGPTDQPVQTVTGTVDVADAGSTVTVFEGMTALGTATVGLDGSWSTSVTLSGDGTHTLVARDTDAAGHT